jgi:eukaryotic-like serine/threonine-protein kinase
MSTNDKLAPGMVLGRYELLLPIAQGGMATVWAARQKGSRGFQKTVAIKTMLPTLSDDPQFEQMFLDEAALAAKIHHPNVAEILDLGEQDEILYIVMEWIDGEALSIVHKAARKNQTQLPQRIALRVAIQACAGLHAAHELHDENDVPLQLVHRDVSPQNVLVTYDGIVKLVDFGVAKAVGRAGGETTAGQLKGKVPYMSPEQARGGQVDRRTDIFAMGIVLYKLTTGLHPFLGENDLVTMRNIISRPLLPPRVKNPSYPQELEQVLVKALQKDPDKRYPTMMELGSALERALNSMGIADDDIGGFVRTLMGDRGAKRRAALRDAVRAADERFATGAHPVVATPGPQVHENVSEIVLTKMNSGVKEEILPERLSVPGAPLSTPSSLSAVSPPPVMSETNAAVVEEVPGVRKGRSGILVGAGVAVAAAALAFALLRSGTSSGSGVLPPPGTGKPVVAAQPPQQPTVAAQPTALAQPTVAVNDPPPSTADPTKPAGTSLSINDLPNADPKKVKGDPRATPSTTASAAVDPKKTRPVSTQWVPPVTNPGF